MVTQNTEGNSGIERVTMEDLERYASPSPTKELPPLTKVGYNLARFLLVYLGVVTVILLVEYFVNAPSLPSESTLNETSLTIYTQLSQISLDRTVKLFQILVLTGFLPVLTAVLEYIFGTRGERSDS
jgi:hypothetical protein